MAKPIENRVTSLLKDAEGMYHQLVLLVGKSGSGKTSVIQNVAKLYETTPININLALSEELLELTKKQRQLKLSEILAQVVEDKGEVVFLDNIEILFDVELKQDPLRLLQGLSRNITLLASWNGIIDKEKLIYADPSHREYKSYDVTNTLMVSMND